MCTTSFHARREDFFYLISCVQHEQNSRSVHAAHWKTDVWFFGFWTLNPRLHTAIEFQGPTTPIRVLNDFQVKLFGTIPLVCPLLLTKACFSHEAENQGTSFLFPLPPPPPPPHPLPPYFIFSRMLGVALHHLSAWDRSTQKQQRTVTCFQPPAWSVKSN